MIKRGDRLIMRAVAMAIGTSMLVLLAIDSLSALVRELDEIGQGGYTLTMALTYVAYTIPRRIYELFPMSAAIGASMGLGGLAPTSELIALRAAGWSKLRICGGALAGVMVLTLAVWLFGETAGTAGERAAQGVAIGAKSNDLVTTSKSGIWARDGQDLLNAKRGAFRQGEVELFDVRLYRFDADGRLLSITHGDKAHHEPGAWAMSQVRQFDFSREQVSDSSSAEFRWQVPLDPALIAMSVVRPRYQSMQELSTHIDYLQRNDLDIDVFESAFFGRLVYPLGVLATSLLAMPFAFSALRSGGFGKRLVVGLVVSLAFYYIHALVVDLGGVARLSYGLAHVLMPGLGIVAGVWWLRRT